MTPPLNLSAAEHQARLRLIDQEQADAAANLEAVDRRLAKEWDEAHGRAQESKREPDAVANTLTAPMPDIRVSASAAIIGGPPSVWVLSVGVQNHSPTDFFLQSVYLETSDGQQAYVKQHFLTGEWNGSRKVEPGNSYDFMIGPKELYEFTREHKLVCAVAADKIGRRFRSDSKKFAEVVDSIVQEAINPRRR